MSGVVPSPYKFTPNRPTDLGEAPAMASARVVAEHARQDADRVKVARLLTARFGEGSVEAQALGLAVTS